MIVTSWLKKMSVRLAESLWRANVPTVFRIMGDDFIQWHRGGQEHGNWRHKSFKNKLRRWHNHNNSRLTSRRLQSQSELEFLRTFFQGTFLRSLIPSIARQPDNLVCLLHLIQHSHDHRLNVFADLCTFRKSVRFAVLE